MKHLLLVLCLFLFLAESTNTYRQPHHHHQKHHHKHKHGERFRDHMSLRHFRARRHHHRQDSVTCQQFEDNTGCASLNPNTELDPGSIGTTCTLTSGGDSPCGTVCCQNIPTSTGGSAGGTVSSTGVHNSALSTCAEFASSIGCGSGQQMIGSEAQSSCEQTSGSDTSCPTMCCEAATSAASTSTGSNPLTGDCSSFAGPCPAGKQMVPMSQLCAPTSGDLDSCEVVCCQDVSVPVGAPPNWLTLPDLTALSGRTVDPWVYADRLALYKAVIEKMRSPFFNDTLGLSEGNSLWGLPLQLYYQMRTKRLNAYTSRFINNMHLKWTNGQPLLCRNNYRLRWMMGDILECETSNHQSDGSGMTDMTSEYCAFANPVSNNVRVQVECNEPIIGYRDYSSEVIASFRPGAQTATVAGKFQITYTVTEVSAPDDGSTISPYSWWAAMNYYQSVAVYMGAEKATLVPALTFAAPSALVNKYCSPRSQCETDTNFNKENVVDLWSQYFLAWKALKTRSDSGGAVTESDLDNLRQLEWAAHDASIQIGVRLFDDESQLMPVPEREFGLGYASLVAFVSPTRLNIDFAHFNSQVDALPSRKLTDCDTSTTSCAPDIGMLQQAMVLACTGLYFLEQCQPCYTPFLTSWQRAMTTDAARSHGRDIIEQTFQTPMSLKNNLKQVVTDYLQTNSPSQLTSLTLACLKCGPQVLAGVFLSTETGHIPGDCGSTLFQRILAPDEYGSANFGTCCRGHDVCYDNCHEVKSNCDNNFHTCLTNSCNKAYPSGINSALCHAEGDGYFWAVSTQGATAWDAAQLRAGC